MAYYAYKAVRDLVPESYQTTEHWRRRHCAPSCVETPCKAACTYDGDANYDGDMWTVTADYIEDLLAEIEALKAAKSPPAPPQLSDVP